MLISVASEDFDPAAALIDRDDFELAFNDDSRGQKDALIGPLKLPYSGEYDLAISATPLMMPQGAESGDFAVTIMPIALMRHRLRRRGQLRAQRGYAGALLQPARANRRQSNRIHR